VERLKVRKNEEDLNTSPPSYIPELVVYPNVHHGYDLPPGRGNTNQGEHGWLPNPQAAEDTRKRAIALFQKHLGND
jgi:hypothetical protein